MRAVASGDPDAVQHCIADGASVRGPRRLLSRAPTPLSQASDLGHLVITVVGGEDGPRDQAGMHGGSRLVAGSCCPPYARTTTISRPLGDLAVSRRVRVAPSAAVGR